MTIKELTDKLSEFDPDLEIEFEFEEYSADSGTWLLEPGVIMKLTSDKESLLFNFTSRGNY